MFLNPFFALAQSNGVVVNSNNQPLRNVDVFLADQNIVVKTNVDGEFSLKITYLITLILTFLKMDMFQN